MSFFDGFRQGLLGGDLTRAESQGPGTITRSIPSTFSSSLGSTTIGLFGTGATSPARGSKELLEAYRNNPTLRKVVNLIANQIASTDFVLGQTKNQRKARSKALRVGGILAKAMDVDEIIDEHPFLDFLETGNPVMPGPSGLKLSSIYYLLKGEFFWLLMPSPDGTVGWIVIPPHWVQDIPEAKGEGKFKIIFGTKTIEAPAEMVLWVRDPDVVNPFGRGSGHGDSLKDEIDTDEYASQLMRVTMANKGLMEGVLSIDGASQESLVALRRDFESKHRGTGNSGKTLVVDGASVKYSPLTQAFSELKLLELREAEKVYIEEQFCVPPELFGKVSNSNRATIYFAYETFAKNTLIPMLSLFSREIGLRLLPLFDKTGRLYLDFVSPLPSDDERSLEIMRLSPQSFRANEIREAAGYGAEPWGDVRYVEARYIEVPAPLAGRGRGKALNP